MEVSRQLHAPAALPQGKSPWYPLDRRLGGSQSRPRRGGEEKNSQPLIMWTKLPTSNSPFLPLNIQNNLWYAISHYSQNNANL
jgi:hypothetical protein